MINICLCGCGQPTKIIKKTNTAKGLKKGEYTRYLPNHQWKTNSPSRPDTSEWTSRPRPQMLGAKHPAWKDKVTYGNLHSWLNRTYPRNKICTKCGGSPTEYANISKNYLRDISDWIELCRSCHRTFDGSRGETHHNAKLTQANVDYIRKEWAKDTHISKSELANKFGVSRGLIGHITKGRAWKQ